jgi:ribosomal protein S27E
MGFSIDGSRIVCVECGDTHDEPAIGVGGMLRYATDGGEGHVFALACPSCDAKGLLFEAPDATVGTTADIVDALTARARH